MTSDDFKRERLALAGDIGGTKANLGIFSLEGGRPTLQAMESYSSRDAESLEDLIELFLGEHPSQVSVACFGIAGPVRDGVIKPTNLPWTVSEGNIKSRFGLEQVCLINDLVAMAYSVPVLEPSDDVYQLNQGKPDPQGTMGLVAPGTGLGVALLVVVNGRVYPVASEAGHVDFAPRNEMEMELLRHLLSRSKHVSVERLASGPGLMTIYLWLRDYRNCAEPSWLTERLLSNDPSKVISEIGMSGEDPICVEALDLFVSILGAAAGNLALTGLTTGGLYLGGGISPKILKKLEADTFMTAFTSKGRFSSLMTDIPVRVILNERAALIGAASHALEE